VPPHSPLVWCVRQRCLFNAQLAVFSSLCSLHCTALDCSALDWTALGTLPCLAFSSKTYPPNPNPNPNPTPPQNMKHQTPASPLRAPPPHPTTRLRGTPAPSTLRCRWCWSTAGWGRCGMRWMHVRSLMVRGWGLGVWGGGLGWGLGAWSVGLGVWGLGCGGLG